jgi:hypothetical protein
MASQIRETRLASRRLQHVLGQLADDFYKPPYPMVINPYDGEKDPASSKSGQISVSLYNSGDKLQACAPHVQEHKRHYVQANQLSMATFIPSIDDYHNSLLWVIDFPF